jgi:hypothetical protein
MGTRIYLLKNCNWNWIPGSIYVWNWCDRTKSHSNNVNTTGFRVSFLFDCCQWPSTFWRACNGNYSIAAARNAWVGDLVCLCYGEQELRRAMDGGGSNCIEEGLRNRQWEVSIRGSMKERGSMFFLV